ncbi:thioesterase domain-containing protein [Rhodoblastus acidophilus]|uniref:condensation domain-containing protein n=1 Tax=Rhodoblastus acidophilus TaxID=1074 RepID=UPI0022243C4D|nr:condensation domain-containing protein [Rhodoblastus acidophilus]MCW2283818.1 thioesterase domain-containing protein [Rhodoblastus acidophilus]MCW2332833.1 thioesterase domain-containing protein [Rhodoblastus acidophilus]
MHNDIQAAVGREPEPQIVMPCTAIQQHVLELQTRSPDSSIANIAMRWRLLGAVRDTSVKAALQVLASRHESLRTRFARGENGFQQVVSPSCDIKLSRIDLSLQPDLYEAEADRIARLDARTAFDPTKAPPWRVTLLRRSAREAILLATFHHAIADGWSIGVFARELAAVIDALEQGRAPDLPELDLQYGDYARWRQALLASDALTGERAYWRRQMAGVVPLDVTPTRDPPATGRREGEIRSVLLPRALTDALQAVARREGYTLFALAGACLGAALGEAWRSKQLLIGTQVGGRDDPLLFGVIGPVVNTVVLRLDATLASDSWAFADHVRAVVNDALANKALPFEDIVAGVQLSSQPDLPFGYNVNFTLQSVNIDADSTDTIRSGDVELASIPSVSAGSLYDLSFFMVGRDEGWRISCEVNTDRHTAEAAETLLAAWRGKMEMLVAAPRVERPVGGPTAAVQPLLRKPSKNYFEPCKLFSAGKLPPVFALSNRSIYYPVARRLADDRPFIDLQWRSDATPPPANSDVMSDIAADAARQIRAVDPVGPYHLVSYCVMGNVALETARQLRAAGSQVLSLCLLDTVASGYVENMSWPDRLLRRALVSTALPNLRDRLLKVWAGELSIAGMLSYYFHRVTRPPETLQPGDDTENIWLKLMEARAHHRIEPYEGDVVLFRSAEARVGRLFARSLGWSQFVKGDLRIYDVPGRHDDMLKEPAAEVISEYMAWTIDKAEGRWKTPPAQT